MYMLDQNQIATSKSAPSDNGMALAFDTFITSANFVTQKWRGLAHSCACEPHDLHAQG